MKKSITTSFAILWALALFAQEPADKQEYKNEVGFELLGVFNKDFQVTYERALGRYISISGGFGYKIENGIITLTGLQTESIQIDDVDYSGPKINLSAKYYLREIRGGKMTGFYFGAFLKFQNYDSNVTGDYINDAAEEFVVDFDADLGIRTLGLMVGYKAAISKRFIVDFLIFGPGASRHRYKIRENVPLPDEFYDDLNDALNKYGLIDLLDGEYTFDGQTRETKFSIPGFRYGISIAYAF
ncbi:MAG: hypothetical protein ACR2MM_11540 [Flavobacteriaceae bacterium]